MLKQSFSFPLYLFSLLIGLILIHTQSQADTCGKADIGPAYLHVDVLESGHTVKKINMPGVRLDVPFVVWKGVCIKPAFLYGGAGSTQVWSAGCGIGYYIPIDKQISVTPVIGVTYTNFKTTFHVPIAPDMKIDLRERFRSISPYLGLEATYTFCKGWRLTGIYQYAWSHSDTTIKGMGTTKSNPKGSNFAMQLEYDLNNKWSINLGAAYNESLTAEKHGLRGYGARIGFAYWF